MGAPLPSSANPQAAQEGTLEYAVRVCGVMALSSDLDARRHALELHEIISECWHHLKAVCGMRWMLAGIPAEFRHDVRACERYILEHHETLVQRNPHIVAVRRLSDHIHLASGHARDLLRSQRLR